MTSINVAVIGVGNMGRHHARVYSEIPNVNLVAICDKNLATAKNLAATHNCNAYDDYAAMFKTEKIDAVSIVVPTFLHAKVACDVLDRNCSVFLEKPIATTVSEAEEIILKAKTKKLKLMIGHIERFNPVVSRLKELLNEGRLGEIISINAKRAGGLPPQIKNANVMLDLGIHDIDISNYLAEDYPVEIYGFKSKNIISEQDDSAVVLLKYKKLSSFIEVNWVTPVKVRTLDITGMKGFARIDYINQTLTLHENSYLNRLDRNYTDFNEFISKYSLTDEVRVGIEKSEPLKKELESFIASIVGNTDTSVTGEDGLKALKIALKV